MHEEISENCTVNLRQDAYAPGLSSSRQDLNGNQRAETERGPQTILERDPYHPEALYLRRLVADQQWQLDDAIELITATIAQVPSKPNHHLKSTAL